MSKFDVIALGDPRWEEILVVETDDAKNPVFRVNRSLEYAGGSSFNTLSGLTKLGLTCGLIGEIGADSAGDRIINEARNAGIWVDHLQTRVSAPTDRTLIIHDSLTKQNRVLFQCHREQAIDFESVLTDILSKTRLLHLAGVGQSGRLKKLADILKDHQDIMLSISINREEAGWGISEFKDILARADVLFVDKPTLEELTGKNWRKAARMCRATGLRCLVLFLGYGEKEVKIKKKNSAACIHTYIQDAEYECVIESAVRKWPGTVDTTGVQDTFAAGYLYGLLSGFPLEKRGFIGDIMAQACLKDFGVRDSLPDPEEVTARYSQIHREELG